MKTTMVPPGTLRTDSEHGQNQTGDHGAPGPILGTDRRSLRRYAVARIGFGVIWGIDAGLKWLPGFRDHYLSMIQASGHGQPSWLVPWFHFWASMVQPAPGLFAVLTAVAETAICLSLVLGIAQRACFAFGAGFALVIWGVGEGFGGPYMNGSTDIGCAVMYSALFAVLWLAVPRAIRAAAPSVDSRLVRRWPWLAPLTFIRVSHRQPRS
jgi:thiosulfate dehydrogenase (quinone) large subunit